MKNLSIPCIWDETILRRILSLKSDGDVVIKELYGAIPNNIVPTGRYNKTLNLITREKALNIKKNYVEKNGLKFAYLLNSPIDISNIDKENLEEYLHWIINVFKAESLTISSYTLMQYVRKLYSDVRINISTIAGIKDEETFKKYSDIKPNRIVLHHDCVRDIDALKKMIERCSENDINLEIMVNESCINHCKQRRSHYDCLANNTDDHRFHIGCNSMKVNEPHNLLYANYIRPEDLELYKKLGVNLFKVTGRSKPNWWYEEVVTAYLNESYSGNLIRLLGIDPALKAEEWIYINNSNLNGFAEMLCANPEKQIEMCQKKICELYKNGDFKVNKESIKYNVIEHNLVCSELGGDLYE